MDRAEADALGLGACDGCPTVVTSMEMRLHLLAGWSRVRVELSCLPKSALALDRKSASFQPAAPCAAKNGDSPYFSILHTTSCKAETQFVIFSLERLLMSFLDFQSPFPGMLTLGVQQSQSFFLKFHKNSSCNSRCGQVVNGYPFARVDIVHAVSLQSLFDVGYSKH